MSGFDDQIPFGGAEFAENPEPRCPCMLLLDTSGSMHGKPINELNEGIEAFKYELLNDSMAVKRVEISVITFGPVKIESDFQTADSFQPQKLDARGDTPMGKAIEQAIEMLKQRKNTYNLNGIPYYRPWIFLITDGAPTDAWKKASELVKEGENAKSFMFFAVGVEGANMDILNRLSVREPLKLKGLRFKDMFSWLSNSLRTVSRSVPGDQVPLENPAAPEGWASIE